MNSMKRLGLAALLVALGALFTAPQAFARNTEDKLTYELVAPEIDPPEPEAFGQYTLTDDSASPLWPWEVDASCRQLTPWNLYCVVATVFWSDEWGNCGWYYLCRTFTADKNGKLEGQFIVDGGWCYVSVQDLWVENNVGQVVLETGRLVRSK